MILVIGCRGQVGTRLVQLLGAQAIDAAIDLTQIADIAAVLARYRPLAVINAAARTDVNYCESHVQNCMTTNTLAVLKLAQLTADYGIPLVNYSTDYVFDGLRRTPYSETSRTAPLNVYGRSKQLMEQGLTDFAHCLTIRTSWVFDHQGRNFFTRLAQSRNEPLIHVVADQYGSPTWARDLAETTLLLLQHNCRGLYHYAGLGECSWYQLAYWYAQRFMPEREVRPISSHAYNSKLQRPAYSVLATKKITPLLPSHLRKDWELALNECFLAPAPKAAAQTGTHHSQAVADTF